jgi:hypothetical protein
VFHHPVLSYQVFLLPSLHAQTLPGIYPTGCNWKWSSHPPLQILVKYCKFSTIWHTSQRMWALSIPCHKSGMSHQ